MTNNERLLELQRQRDFLRGPFRTSSPRTRRDVLSVILPLLNFNEAYYSNAMPVADILGRPGLSSRLYSQAFAQIDSLVSQAINELECGVTPAPATAKLTDEHEQRPQNAQAQGRFQKAVTSMSWKDHPLAVASVSIAGTTALILTVMFSAVIPTWLRSKDNEIAAKEAQIGDLNGRMVNLEAEPTRLKNELGELGGQLKKMESENIKLRRDLDKLSTDKLFSMDDVYPRGFRGVRIGDRIDLVTQVYGGEAVIKDEYDWITVLFKKPHPFSSIAYYYDQNAKVKTVRSILFVFGNLFGSSGDATFNMLKQQLIDTYSEAAMKEISRRGEKVLVWSGIQKHTLELTNHSLGINLAQ
jgi:hypothetical protein